MLRYWHCLVPSPDHRRVGPALHTDTKCYPPERIPGRHTPNLSAIELALIARRPRMNTTTHTEPTGLLYEFGDLLLAVTAVLIVLVGLPLYLS